MSLLDKKNTNKSEKKKKGKNTSQEYRLKEAHVNE